MSGKLQMNSITNGNVYLDGLNLLGRAAEVSLPDLKAKMEEHSALGLIGTPEFFAGFEKLDGKIKWESFYDDVAKRAANPRRIYPLQVRSSLETYTAQGLASEKPLVTFLSVAFKKLPTGVFKPKAKLEYETEFTCYYVKQTLDGQEILELDILENIFKVNGEDLLATWRANIGA